MAQPVYYHLVLDMEQGLGTAMTQVVAEALGLCYEGINVVPPDSATSPAGMGVFARMGITSVVGTAWRAALGVKQKLFEIAATQLEGIPEQLEAKERRVYIKGQPEVGIPIAKATGSEAVPLNQNVYKVQITDFLVKRAVLEEGK